MNTVWSQRFDSTIRFFLYILIFWLPYSPAAVEVCVIMGFLLWCVKRAFVIHSFKLPETPLKQPIAIFLFACLLSVMGSPFLSQSIHNFFTKTMEWFIIYFLVLEVFTRKRHIYIFLWVLLFTAFATAIDSIFQFYCTFKDIFLGRTIEPWSRATAAFKAPNALGSFLTFVVPITLVMQLKKPSRRWERGILFLSFVSATWALIITFSRGAWLGVAVGTLFLLFWVYGVKKNTWCGSLPLLFLVGASSRQSYYRIVSQRSIGGGIFGVILSP